MDKTHHNGVTMNGNSKMNGHSEEPHELVLHFTSESVGEGHPGMSIFVCLLTFHCIDL